jgi:hypothetical protein
MMINPKKEKNRLMLGVKESNSETWMRCFRTTTDEDNSYGSAFS